MGPSSVNNLRIWHLGMEIVRDCYSLTADWPKHELVGLTSQVRRAAVSIPSNLAEGRGRGSNAEMARFGQIALGSVYELDTLLQIAADLRFAHAERILSIREQLESLSKQIASFVKARKAA